MENYANGRIVLQEQAFIIGKDYTEDEVRTEAGRILDFCNSDGYVSGVGQITTFNQLGFKGVAAKPDGWYLPKALHEPAIILEAKGSRVTLKTNHVEELLRNCEIIERKYKNWIGILFNGFDIKVYKNGELLTDESKLHNKEHYLGLFEENTIDSQRIYTITKRINDLLHFQFGVTNLKQRMIFTACALVARRYGALLQKGMSYELFRVSILDTLKKSYADDKNQNSKLELLLTVYAEVKMNITDNQEAIDSFIELVEEIADDINSRYWNGEDVMAIFFNEFNRYKAKSDQGQVFTPDHITSLMYRLIGVNADDRVLDAACGSGAFLVKAMCNMIKEAGGIDTEKARMIMCSQLFGVEFDKEIYALACANMLIHKDGKTNLIQDDSRSARVADWIRSKGISKVLMNPPFENKYGCIDIVTNILNNVQRNALCAFIMPDKKLEKSKNKALKLLKNHSLEKIIKLPEKTFNNLGVTTSIFIFRAGVPQNGKEVFTCYIEEDGLETIKNQGRQDIRKKWGQIEDYWVDAILKQGGSKTIKWIVPAGDCLSYQNDEAAFDICEEDFVKMTMDYLLYENGIDVDSFSKELMSKILYAKGVKTQIE